MKYGCIAEKLGHSFSKEIHNALTDYEYELHEVAKDDLHAFMTAREFTAINVTIPYKQDVIPYLHEISDTARMIGAVNTIVNRNGKLYGYNTDFGGMIAQLSKMGLCLQDKKVLILGTGGTSRTAENVARHLGASEIVKASRTGKDGAATYEEVYAKHTDAEVIINTTPSGMYPKVDEKPIDLSAFPRLEGLLDAVYNPLRTQLVLDARELGIKAEGGLYMLVMQAVLAAEIFTGTPIAPEKSEEVYRKILHDKENIVLIGMPGSGKSSVGRKLCAHLERELVDTDAIIVTEQQCPIADIFAEKGEAVFRDMETDVVKRVSLTGGRIVSTGGGAVLRHENVRALRQNGRLFFLDRPLELLKPTASRPLSSTREDMEKRFYERYELYCRVCDEHIHTTPTQEETAKLIEGIFLA